jgi:hypothetical protein
MLASLCSEVLEHSSPDPRIEDSNPPATVTTERKFGFIDQIQILMVRSL